MLRGLECRVGAALGKVAAGQWALGLGAQLLKLEKKSP